MATRRKPAVAAKKTAGAKRASGGASGGASRRASRTPALALQVKDSVALLAFARPERDNAIDGRLLADLIEVLTDIDTDPALRALVLLGAGATFCAGEDIAWLGSADARDAALFARAFDALAGLRKPTIARVHGAVGGSGVGLLACCDVVVAAQDATFALTHARFGIAPDIIAARLVAAMGARHAQRYLLSGEEFTAAEAFRIGLVHELAPPAELDARVNEILGGILQGAPGMQQACKVLLRGLLPTAAASAEAARAFAQSCAGAEARESLAARAAGRTPRWVPRALVES